MQFLYPSFLWALLALAIPIIIHLFYFRRFKKVSFTNVKFLKEIKEETSSRNKLKNLLILLMRCLALAAMVFAFAQPYYSNKNNSIKGSNAISIFVDNSASMSGEYENVPLIDIAKEKARELVGAYSDDDVFQILTHDFEGKHQRLVSKEEAISLINEVDISPEVKQLSRVFDRQKQVLNRDNNYIYVISDFQKSITDIQNENDTLYTTNLIPIQSVLEKNVSIDSAWFESPVPILNQTNKLIFKLTNHGENPAERVKTSIYKDNQEKPINVVDIPAKSSITDTVSISILKSGIQEAIIKINDFPIQFDDQLFISFSVPEQVKVLAINSSNENKYLNALFNGISYFQLDNQSTNQIQFQQFNEYNLILLNDLSNITTGLANELKQFIVNGGKVVIFPNINSDINSYNSFLSSAGASTLSNLAKTDKQVLTINIEEFVFNDVFESVRKNIKLPNVKAAYSIGSTGIQSQEPLLKFRDNTSYLSKFQSGLGYIYLCASPLANDYNDLVLNAEIFVPMLYKMALSSSTPQKLAYTIGVDNIIQVNNRTVTEGETFTVIGEEEFIPGMINYGKNVVLDINNQVSKSGMYNLMLSEESIQKLAFNYDRTESDPSIYSVSDLTSLLKNTNIQVIDTNEQDQLSTIVKENESGKYLWKYFIIAALIFLLLEIIFVRLLKN